MNTTIFDEIINICRILTGKTRIFILNEIMGNIIQSMFKTSRCPIKKGNYSMPAREYPNFDKFHVPTFFQTKKNQTVLLFWKAFSKINGETVNIVETRETLEVTLE